MFLTLAAPGGLDSQEGRLGRGWVVTLPVSPQEHPPQPPWWLWGTLALRFGAALRRVCLFMADALGSEGTER